MENTLCCPTSPICLRAIFTSPPPLLRAILHFFTILCMQYRAIFASPPHSSEQFFTSSSAEQYSSLPYHAIPSHLYLLRAMLIFKLYQLHSVLFDLPLQWHSAILLLCDKCFHATNTLSNGCETQTGMNHIAFLNTKHTPSVCNEFM